MLTGTCSAIWAQIWMTLKWAHPGRGKESILQTVCKWQVPGSLQRLGFDRVMATVVIQYLQKPNGRANQRHR